MTELSEQEIQRLAKARVGFRVHALVYVVVNAFLIGIWWVTTFTTVGQGTGTPNPRGIQGYWPIWPEMAWGVGLAIHGFVVYGAGSDWVRREEDRLRRQAQK